MVHVFNIFLSLERYQIDQVGSSDNEPNPGDGFRCKRSTKKNLDFFRQNHSSAGIWKLPFAIRDMEILCDLCSPVFFF